MTWPLGSSAAGASSAPLLLGMTGPAVHVPAVNGFVDAARYLPLVGIFLDEAVHPAVWLGDVERLRTIVAGLDDQARASMRYPVAGRRAALGGLLALTGRVEEAVVEYLSAIHAYRELGVEFSFARTVLDAVVVVGSDRREIGDLTVQARGVFERVGARPYIDRLDAALRTGTTAAR